MRRRASDAELLDALADGWNPLRGELRRRLMLEHPDLYWAIAHLAARRIVTREQQASR